MKPLKHVIIAAVLLPLLVLVNHLYLGSIILKKGPEWGPHITLASATYLLYGLYVVVMGWALIRDVFDEQTRRYSRLWYLAPFTLFAFGAAVSPPPTNMDDLFLIYLLLVFPSFFFPLCFYLVWRLIQDMTRSGVRAANIAITIAIVALGALSVPSFFMVTRFWLGPLFDVVDRLLPGTVFVVVSWLLMILPLAVLIYASKKTS